MNADADWLALLRAEAAASSNAAVARRIGISRTAVSLALAGRYPADTGKLSRRVLQALAGRVACPGLDEEIAAETCRDWAAKPFAATSSHRVRMYRACQSCPRNPGGNPHAE